MGLTLAKCLPCGGAAGGSDGKPPLCSATLGVIRIDSKYPPNPGDITHPDSFPYDVIYRVVPGLDFVMCQSGKMTPEVEKEFIEAVKFLVSKKVSGITGDCGFMFWFQPLVRKITNIPVFMSSLCMLPAITCAYAKNEPIAIVSANGNSLAPMHDLILEECGVEVEDKRYVIIGLQDVPHFNAVAMGTQVDYAKVEPGVVEELKRVLKERPDIRALVFECTQIPQFADSARYATGLPVYDAISTADAFMTGFQDNPRFGKQTWRKDRTLMEKENYHFGINISKENRMKLKNAANSIPDGQ